MNKEKYVVDRLLDKGVKTVDLSDNPELALEMLWMYHDPILIKEVSRRLEDLEYSLRVKREKIRKAIDVCRVAGEIAKSSLETTESIAFIEPPHFREIPCLNVIETARDCPSEMCKVIAVCALENDIYRVKLAMNKLDIKKPESVYFKSEYELFEVSRLIRLAFRDFFNNLDEGQYAVDLEARKVIPWPEEKKQKD